jgi:hypothetical protein
MHDAITIIAMPTAGPSILVTRMLYNDAAVAADLYLCSRIRPVDVNAIVAADVHLCTWLIVRRRLSVDGQASERHNRNADP